MSAQCGSTLKSVAPIQKRGWRDGDKASYPPHGATAFESSHPADEDL